MVFLCHRRYSKHVTTFKTADLCDAHPQVSVAEPRLKSYGGRRAFSGPITTIKAFEDNSLVRAALGEPGAGRVLVVDGGGSRRCAMLGDQLAHLGQSNGWSGVVVYGCIRDSEDLVAMDLGVMALATHPMKSSKRNEGQRDISVRFLGVTFEPGAYLYADSDGLIVSPQPLLREE